MAQNLKVSQPYANAFIQMVSGKDSLDKVISDLTYIEAALKSPVAYKQASVEVAHVISSSEMSESQQEALVSKLKAMTGVKQVKLDIKVDKALIGGFTVQIGSQVVDTSIQGQLKKLASHLGASSPL